MRIKTYIVTLVVLLSMLVSTVGLANPKTFDFNFIDEDIRVVLHTVAKFSNVDMVIDDSVKGNITIKLSKVTFNTALNLITEGKGLTYRQVGNSFIIEPSDIGHTEVIKLQNARALDIKKTLEPIATGLKVKLEPDEISNSIIMTGSPAGVSRIKTVLKGIDIKQQQITIEAKVVSINKNNNDSLGIDWSWTTPTYPEITRTDATATTPGTITETRITHAPTVKFGTSPLGVPYEMYFTPTLNALISKGNAKILASPKVTTVNGKEARILIGDRIPVVKESLSGTSTTTSVEYIDAGIKLTYTPTVTSEGMITAKVRTEVSDATLVSDIKNYKITTREAETTVNLKDGQVMVIGGLIGSVHSKANKKIPLLGDLPIIGSLFKNNTDAKSDTEVVIFLKATIVKDDDNAKVEQESKEQQNMNEQKNIKEQKDISKK